MPNPYEQFDPSPPAPNPYERFDTTPASEGLPAKITVRPSPQGLSPQGLANAIEPITALPSTYSGMVRHGLDTISQGSEQAAKGVQQYGRGTSDLERAIQGIQEGKDIGPAVQQAQETPTRERSFVPIPDRLAAVSNILGGFGKIGGGTAEYLGAPVFAPIRSIASQPIENVVGIPKEYTEFAAGLALPIPRNIPGVARAPAEFVPTRPTIPSEEALRASATRRYQAPEVVNTPLMPPQAATQLGEQIMFDLAKGRTNDVTAKAVYDLVGKLERPPPGVVGFGVDNIESLRQQLGELGPVKDATGRVTNKPELRAAQIAKSRIDEFLRQNAPQAAATLEQARGDFGAAESAATLSRKEFRAELRAAAANSGKNLSNTMRQRIADILLDPSQRRGYSRTELAAMEQIVRGTRLENSLRYAGNFLGGGGGLGALVTTAEGIRALGPVGAIAALPGAALKSLSNVMTARNIERLNEIIRSDSPLGRQLQTPLSDWTAAQQQFASAPSARTRARMTLSARNLSNNLADAGIKITPDRLIGGERPMDTGDQQ